MELMRNGCRNFATRQNVISALDARLSPRLDAGNFLLLARASLQAGRGRDEGLGAHRGSERPRHGRYERRGVRVREGTPCTEGAARAHAEAQARAAASLPASLLASPKKFWGPEGQSEVTTVRHCNTATEASRARQNFVGDIQTHRDTGSMSPRSMQAVHG